MGVEISKEASYLYIGRDDLLILKHEPDWLIFKENFLISNKVDFGNK